MNAVPMTSTVTAAPYVAVTNSWPTDRLRVLHLINGEHFSGAERVQMHLAHRLPAVGFEADFACLKPDRFPEHFDAPCGQVFELPMQGRIDLRVGRRVEQLMQEGNHRLLHAHTPRTAMVAALASRRTGVPWIYHVHSPTARDSGRTWQNRINDLIEHLSLTNCEHLITVSESLRQTMLTKGWNPSRVSVVHNGVPAQTPHRRKRSRGCRRWRLAMVALMRPRKGVEVLLQACRRCVDIGHDVHLRMIGPFETDDYCQQIHRQAKELKLQDRIEWLGFTRDVTAALRDVDALVLPSLYGEGLPMVVLEAMALAIPVIATEVEGTPEAVRHGQEGLLAKPNDPESLAFQIANLASEKVDWNALSEAAFERHRRAFSDKAMAAGVAEVYRAVLDKHYRLG